MGSREDREYAALPAATRLEIPAPDAGHLKLKKWDDGYQPQYRFIGSGYIDERDGAVVVHTMEQTHTYVHHSDEQYDELRDRVTELERAMRTYVITQEGVCRLSEAHSEEHSRDHAELAMAWVKDFKTILEGGK